jgi:hypothetical protein
MKRELVLSLCASLMFAYGTVIAATQITSALSVSGLPGESITLDVSRTTPEYTSISISNPDIQVVEMVEDFETYQAFVLDGEPFIPEEGSPAVPQVTRFYRIPNTGGVDLIIRNVEFTVQDNINPYPYVAERSSFSRETRNIAQYSQDAWYPEQVATISAPIIFRDFRVVTVTLHPVQVNPVTGQARIYSQINVDIVANDQPGFNELLNPRRPSGTYAAMYRDAIVNLDENALDDMTTTPGTYLIISKDNATINPHDSTLATWKKRKGYDVHVEKQAWANSTAIINYIRSFAETADPPLEFVCLMGDPSATFGVPSDSPDGWSGNFDHSYALSNPSDDVEDWAVGRLSGADAPQMATIMAKIINYESNPYMAETDWFTSGYFVGDIGHSIASNYVLMQWASQQFINNTGIVNNEVDHSTDGSGLTTMVPEHLGEGVSVFLWRGSYLNQMTNGLAATCNSGWKLPVVMTITCGAGNFVNELGTQESYLVAGTPTSPKGGICGVGTATSGTHNPENVTLASGLIYAMANLELEHFGTCVNRAKLQLTLSWGAGSTAEANFSRYFNLMGDPALSYWTDVPVVIEVTHPMTLNVGAREVRVVVTDSQTDLPVEEALVVLWKGDLDNPETYVKALTNAAGEAILPVSINSAGDLRLTVTKRNHKPYLYEIPCVVVNQMVSFESMIVDDDLSGGTTGNNDGLFNPGETIDLNVTLKNHGSTTTATAISATLTSANPNITVVNGSATFPNILPAGLQPGNAAFRIHVSPTMKHNETARLSFLVNTAAGSTNSSVEITCHAGAANFVSSQFIEGAFDPGQTRTMRVTVENSGDMPMLGVTGQLVSLSPFVSVDDPNAVYGDIAVSQEITNNADLFQLTANSLAFRGHQANLLLILETSGGYRDTTRFTVYTGTATGADPSGPDSYGYYAYDNTDSGYELAPVFNYVDISSGLGTDLNINDPGNKIDIAEVYSTVRALPFDFKFYGTEYDTVTICANGWMAFCNQPWNDGFRNYPIPSPSGSDAMICPYWDDLKTSGTNQGVWEYYDAVNHRYIVQWKAGVGSNYSTNIDFELILYDPSEYPVMDGNGPILFQYNDLPSSNPTNQPQQSGVAPEISGCSIGIQNEPAIIGLNLAFGDEYPPGVATYVDGRAIYITTDARALFGIIQGTIRDAETNQPMENVQVTLDGFSYHDDTDAAGSYRIENVLIGTYTVRAHKAGFNDRVSDAVLVELDSTETANLTLLHPEFALSTEQLNVSIPPDGPVTSFDIVNDGNGPLDYSVEIVYTGGGDPVDPWGNISDINVSQLTGDMQIQGCEFVGDYWYVSGGTNSPGLNYLYKFNLDGSYAGSIPQPTTSAFGWYDMAYDGTYLYGSEDGTSVIHGIDMSGTIQRTIPSPLNPTRAIAYDPATDHFWIADYTQNIYEISRTGQIFSNVVNEGPDEIAITGLSWNPTDPDGYKLFIYSRASATEQTLVSKMHPVSYDIQNLTVLPGVEGDHSGGCAITGGWNSTLLVFGAIMQNDDGDRLGIYQIDFNTVWIDVDPMVSSVPGGTAGSLTVSFDTQILRNATYQVSLMIHNDVLDQTLELPVVLDVNLDADDPGPDAVLVTEYALYQNYPNPFNPSTTIHYDLKNSGLTKLAVYNIVGQQVAELLNEVQQAGSHSVHFDAADLTSGVYFYRLTSGDFSKTSKMVLMK